ncbi:putative Pollen Ole e 1 allergen and extensin family protein [Quillaja saponaria]|uniref:Pollen Ole e 1 allergen and extensin family protein n=1 Tax=Quillaja saponaria TaxID=32244 RepID=A0AAD7PAE0_QUISA|nr:putative Pollen Ole e 1 allergen and extensin family protein [Quillaja saponaria]
MAFLHVITALLFALALARIDLSTCQVVKGNLTCLDCTHNFDFSGIRVSVKCDQVKKLAVAITEDDGSFKVELPSKNTSNSTALNCLATILGGPTQIFVSRKEMVSAVVKSSDSTTTITSYTTSKPLSFSTSCPPNTKCEAVNKYGSSNTINVPLPPEWGLAPSSFYIPFFPIIGIP